MIWQLAHRLLGWHFVAVKFAGDDCVRRVKKMPNGRLYVSVWGDFVFLDDPSRPVTPLTWIDPPKPLRKVG